MLMRAGGFSISLVKSGKQAGSWKLEIPASVSGKRHRHFFSSKADATRAAKKIDQGLRAPDRQLADQSLVLMSLREAIDRWHGFEQDRVAAGHKAEISLKTDLHRLKSCIHFFGDVDIHTITSEDIIRFQAARRNDGVQPATINSDLRSLMKVLKYGLKAGALDQMPEWAKLEERDYSTGFVLKAAEVSRLVSHLPTFEDQILVRLLAQNGLRQGEAFNLIWDDIDFETETIQIGFRRTFQPKTSTSNRRVFPSTSLLADLSKLHGVRRSDTLVFPSNKDRTKLRTGIKKMLATASRRAGLKQPVTSQMLRQFFATRQAEAGVPEHVLQRDLGHAIGSQVTKKYYIRTDDTVRRGYSFDVTADDRPSSASRAT
ncbi:tyrosine-type recombinase/integrase [Thalassobaculum salexigens]|uniref:tyrosine-type recombinase/integrase n=1 Tax=Thalassobaculum salexigens TaxID=455360 RepID=UPI00048D6497|nr:tyrosine-type recombinase/integrase [Thalassobaculum salexigens]